VGKAGGENGGWRKGGEDAGRGGSAGKVEVEVKGGGRRYGWCK